MMMNVQGVSFSYTSDAVMRGVGAMVEFLKLKLPDGGVVWHKQRGNAFKTPYHYWLINDILTRT